MKGKSRTNKEKKKCIYKNKEEKRQGYRMRRVVGFCVFYDRGRTDSFDVPAGFGLGYLYHGSVSGVGICVILLLNRKQKNQDDRSWFLCMQNLCSFYFAGF